MTGEGRFVEIQGTAEHGTFDLDGMNVMLSLAAKGIQDSFAVQRETLAQSALPLL